MQTRKEYAIGLGLAKPGRGRLSKEAHNAIAAAIENGIQFSDGVKVSARADGSKVVEKNADVNNFAATPAPNFSNDWYFVNAKGKRVSVAYQSACMNCKISLPWHYCTNPKAIVKAGIVEVFNGAI